MVCRVILSNRGEETENWEKIKAVQSMQNYIEQHIQEPIYLYQLAQAQISPCMGQVFKDLMASALRLYTELTAVTRSLQYNSKAKIEDRITFKEPKTRKGKRLIALTPSNAIVLREHYEKENAQRLALGYPGLNNNDLVFSHYDGSPFLPNTITHAWIKITRRCGLDGIRLHDARHTHASLLLKQGVHPKVVQERPGHGSIQVTLDTYSHVAPGLQQAAAEKFDSIALPNKEASIKIN